MGSVNEGIYDRAVDRSAMGRLYERNVQGKIEDVLDRHTVRTSDLVGSHGDLRSRQFADDLDLEIATTYDLAHNTSSRSLLDLFADQTSYMVQNIEAGIGKVWNTFRPATRIAEEVVLQRPLYKDVTLLRGWSGIASNERLRIEQLIRRLLAAGKSVPEIALEVRRGNVFNISRSQSFGLVRTAITSVQSQADHEVYAANSKALNGYQFIAVLDSRTSAICAHNDGRIFPIGDVEHLPPLHWHCRSTTIPIVKNYDDLSKLEGVAQIRKKNLEELTDKQKAYYDGLGPQKESYDQWLRRQPTEVQLRHIGDLDKLELFRSGQLTLDKFSNAEGKSLGIRELRQLTDSGYAVAGDTRKFALAKEKLDVLKLGAARPEDFMNSKDLTDSLREYYLLQSGDLSGTLSFTNYRGTTIGSKKQTRNRVLNSPPTDANLKFNPITGRFEDARLYQPSPAVLENNLRLVSESTVLRPTDKQFITDFVSSLEDSMSVNERAAITDNLRIVFGRYRSNAEPWTNLKAVLQGQIKFDVMNVSDFIETQLRRDQNLLKRLNADNYFDSVLGETDLQMLHDTFIDNIKKRNAWDDRTAPKIAAELRDTFDLDIPYKLRARLEEKGIADFYKRFAGRLSLANGSDRDQLAISLGRDLYNSANYRGTRRKWYELGLKLVESAQKKGFFKLETYGVQKRRLKSRLSAGYVGPVYDTFSVNIRNIDPRLQEYSQLNRKIDVGLRLGVTTEKNKLYIKPGSKTYWYKDWLGLSQDTRIPITSTDSFHDFPVEMIDSEFAKNLNWAASGKFKVDNDFHDFIEKLLNFKDDKGQAQFYDDLNKYREYITERGDSYERFKAMKWLRSKDAEFSNHPFLDHRARLYERGMIGPQAGEAFRPFLNTADVKKLGVEGFQAMQDTVGATLGGISDYLEGRFNSLSQVGRQQIAERWRPEMVRIGNLALRGKPNDIREILKSDFLARIDGEEQGKVLRLAMELAKIDNYLGGNYSKVSLQALNDYDIALALEQDASSSGAQIIAMTTKNKQLAQLSNVVATNQKQRLYDEIAASTFNDPRFRELNKKLGLTEKDLRKAAKAQNMVTFYGAGEKTGMLRIEDKLSKVIGKQNGTLVVRAKDRDIVLNEISAQAERYRKFDPEKFEELQALRNDVKDLFNKGREPGVDLIEELYFLEPKTRDLVEKLSGSYINVVTPDDFTSIAKIMSEELRRQVPILKDFTKYFGRLAKDYAEATGNTVIPWKTFDGKTIEQNFTLTYEERLVYKTDEGKYVTNFIQSAQRTDPTFFDELLDRDGKIRDIVDLNKAATAFAVNGNHSNDAVIVRQFHGWGRDNGITTATIHDAFFTNTADLTEAKNALRRIYSELVETSPIEATLKEMRDRGLPRSLYNQYLNEAKDIGLIPVVGRSVVGGKTLTEDDILKAIDILEEIPSGFTKNRGWYGIGP